METIPLFPLDSLLFPKGRISLQIFESRYVDMIRRCLKQESGFGIVLIEQGSEVAQLGQKLAIHRVGTYAEVVDWNPLANGLLGITAEGRMTFQIIESWREADELCMARVSFRQDDAVSTGPIPVTEAYSEYVGLLERLTRHPAIEELKLDICFDDLREIAWRLSELLPLSNQDKQSLLELSDPVQRLEKIELFVNMLNG
ncbi:MAG: LON peptidase substrate-binding domain-containing protein [Pseudomonadales bacterium]|nr:LON peptidase substrate-binding domain-containing protein [Pseudomonadales bacterium]